jgi:hypothetical protein
MAFYRCTFSYNHRGKTLQNVIHLEEETNLMSQELIAMIVAAHWPPLFDNLQFSQMLLRFIEIRRILVQFPLSATLIEPNRFAVGSLTGEVGSYCFKILFRTDLAGKQHRGRYYVPGIAFGLVDVGFEQLGPAGITRMTNAVLGIKDKFCGGPNSVGLRLVIRHKDDNLTPTRVSSVLFSQRPHWLRSREPGHGI